MVFGFDVRSYETGKIVGTARGARIETIGVEMLLFSHLGNRTVTTRHRANHPRIVDRIIIPEIVLLNGREYTVTEIVPSGFLSNNLLNHVSLPNSITRIGNNAFLPHTELSWTNNRESFSFAPQEFGFENQYFTNPRTTIHNLNGLNANIRRQRTAFNPNENLMVLSANRERACPTYGAFFEFRTPSQSFNRLEIELGLWSGIEFSGSRGIEIYLWYLNSAGVWQRHTNLKQLGLPMRAHVATFAFNFRYNVRGFRLSVRVDNPQGIENRGRLVVGNMSLHTASIPPQASDFITTNIGSSSVAITGTHRHFVGSVTLPDSFVVGTTTRRLTQIGFSAFAGHNELTEVIVPRTVTNIGNNAFHPNTSVIWSENFIFRNNIFQMYLGNATSFAVPREIAGRTITRIESNAFANNGRISSLTIPVSVNEIGDNAFANMTNLRIITNNANVPQRINSSTFANLDRSNITIRIRYGQYQAFRNAGWTGFNLEENGINFPGILSNTIFVGQAYELRVVSTNSNDPIVGTVVWNISGLSPNEFSQITNTLIVITPSAPTTFTVSATYRGITITVTFRVYHSSCHCNCHINPRPCTCWNDFCRCRPWHFLVEDIVFS